MDLSKRTFLKATGLGSLDPALSSLGFDLPKVQAAAKAFKLAAAREFNSVCNFCACNYVKDGKLIHNGETVKVQCTDAIGLIGGSQVNNEECYQLVKMFRTRGAMTNPRYDLKNTMLARIEGSNLAECHPMGLKNLMKTKKNGLKIMNVVVRYNEDKRKFNGTEVFITWQPYNRGFKGLSKDISGNYITIDALDPNAQSQEFKACLIDIKKA